MAQEAVQLLESLLALRPDDPEAFILFLHQMRDESDDSLLLGRLCRRLERSCDETQVGNTCTMRFPAGYEDPTTLLDAADTLRFIQAHLPALEASYKSFADDASRDLMVDLLSFKALGGGRVKLSTNSEEYWKKVAQAQRTVIRSEVLETGFMGWSLDDCSLEALGMNMRVLSKPLGILGTFLLRQYEYHKGDINVSAERGDVVIDGGGCWGETALYFAHLVGEEGKVFSFEFLPFNLSVMRRNLQKNVNLSGRVRVVEAALWEKSGLMTGYNENGPGSSVELSSRRGGQVPTMSIDTLVQESALDRVNFIKMDIEGAELQALRGAEGTLRTFRPKLAICAYHRPDDLITILPYLQSLDLGYRFTLGHYSIHGEETVLFAVP